MFIETKIAWKKQPMPLEMERPYTLAFAVVHGLFIRTMSYVHPRAHILAHIHTHTRIRTRTPVCSPVLCAVEFVILMLLAFLYCHLGISAGPAPRAAIRLPCSYRCAPHCDFVNFLSLNPTAGSWASSLFQLPCATASPHDVIVDDQRRAQADVCWASSPRRLDGMFSMLIKSYVPTTPRLALTCNATHTLLPFPGLSQIHSAREPSTEWNKSKEDSRSSFQRCTIRCYLPYFIYC